MTPVAFFAPLKAPDHPTPSGDRELARALLQALKIADFTPHIAADLRLLDLSGDADRQADLMAQAHALTPSLVDKGAQAGWRAWITYHNYYKAPDLLGPDVARRLNIPYIQIESTRARKRLNGPWAQFAQASEMAAHAADIIFHFTHRDREALAAYAPMGQTLCHLPPFLARETLPATSTRTGNLLTVAMMRTGDKLASYEILANALQHVSCDWHLDIVGDGPARAHVEDLFHPLANRVSFLGQLERDDIQSLYQTARAFLWPGVGEAIGMVYLEAQAAGIPVIAQNRPGLKDVICPVTQTPAIETGPQGFADAIMREFSDPSDADILRHHVSQNHLITAAAHTLGSTLRSKLEASA